MLEKVKNMIKLQREARQIKKELQNIHIESESDGVLVTINGEQIIISIAWPDEMAQDPKKLQKNLLIALNKGLKKSQQIAAEKMKGVMGQLGMPGA